MNRLFLSLLLLIAFDLKAQNNPDSALIEVLHAGKIEMAQPQITVPIQIWGDMILIEASVNGVKGPFLWDNGFASSAIDTKKVEKARLNLASNNVVSAITDGNNSKMDMGFKLAGHVSIGNLTVTNTAFTTIDFEKIIGLNAKPIGIIGSSIICKLNWKFDFDKNEVTISEKLFEASGFHLPFKIDDYNNSTIIFGVNGNMHYANIDFGSNNNDVEITSNARNLFKGTPKATTLGHLTSSVSGLAKIDTSYTIKDFVYRICDTSTYLSHQFKLSVSNSQDGIRLGNRFFRNYNCIINNRTKVIILSKREIPIDAFPEKSFGAFLTLDHKKIFVISRSTNPNVKLNPLLKLNDQILSINGKKESDFINTIELRNYQLNLLRNNKPMILIRADGKVFTLKPAFDNYE